MKLDKITSVLYVFVRFFGLDGAQNTISCCLLRADELTDKNVLVT